MKGGMLALASVGLLSCSPTLTNAGRSATTGAVEGVTSDASTKRIDKLAGSVVDTARDEVLGPQTDTDLTRIIATANTAIEADLETDVRALTLRLQRELRRTIRTSIDEALNDTTFEEVDDLRDEVTGAPLRENTNALIDSAAPHLATAIQVALKPLQDSLQADVQDIRSLKTDADAEARKWRPIAIGFAVGAALLAAALAFAVTLVRRHKRTIATMTRSLHQNSAPST